MKLKPLKIQELTDPGLYGGGQGLYLQIAKTGTKSWIYRYQLHSRRRDMGLGGYPGVSLAKARKLRDQYRLMVKAGTDPLEVKAGNKAIHKSLRTKEAIRKKTFQFCAEEYMDQKEAGWKNAKHAQQWRNTLSQYAYPIIGSIPVEDIDTHHILSVLSPIWLEKTETANRVRNRIESVLDYAAALKYRSSENPARWRGNLESILAKPAKIRKVKHHTALPYDEITPFMGELAKMEGTGPKALTLTILTATRTSDTLNATWDEFDLKKKIWTIPASRMKAEKEHRIPLSEPALSILKELYAQKINDFVFPGMKLGKPLSNMSMTLVLRRMGRPDLTVHGFRSTFRDWIAEHTNYPHRVAETALAHKIKDGAEAAYQRGDLIEKRKEMMGVWAEYCLPQKTNVTRIRA